MWEIEGTDQFAEWYGQLADEDKIRVEAAIARLQESSPGLGRPLADTIKSSRHSHMKELRPRGGQLRVLFIFDPRRVAILLIGGDKRDQWDEWYAEMVPLADDLYDTYLDELRGEGLL
jgi:hypothetical protein